MAEIWTLKLTNPKDAKQTKAYRLWVKARIYNHNKVFWDDSLRVLHADGFQWQDVLATMTVEERRDKVKEAYDGLVNEDYRNVLNQL